MAGTSTTIVQKRMSFLASLVWGICSLAATIVVCSSAVVAYTLNIADRKSDSLIGFVSNLTNNIPELARSLPPLLSDAVNSERSSGYLPQLKIEHQLVQNPQREGFLQPMITVENTGTRVVALLAMHVVLTDAQEHWIANEETVYAATPFAAEDDMRGPILPSSKRNFALPWIKRTGELRMEIEITDIRLCPTTADVNDIAKGSSQS